MRPNWPESGVEILYSFEHNPKREGFPLTFLPFVGPCPAYGGLFFARPPEVVVVGGRPQHGRSIPWK